MFGEWHNKTFTARFANVLNNLLMGGRCTEGGILGVGCHGWRGMGRQSGGVLSCSVVVLWCGEMCHSVVWCGAM